MKSKITVGNLALPLIWALCLIFMTATLYRPASAQEESTKPHEPAEQQEPGAKQEKPEKQEKPKAEKQEKNATKEDQKEEKSNSQNLKSQHAAGGGSNAEQGGQSARMQPGGKGGHIPDDKFRAHFGKSHTFVISRPVVVHTQPTFQYGGYSFVLVDPWPVGWAYTDQCYIDYIDGDYFLFDVLHPGVRIALFVAI